MAKIKIFCLLAFVVSVWIARTNGKCYSVDLQAPFDNQNKQLSVETFDSTAVVSFNVTTICDDVTSATFVIDYSDRNSEESSGWNNLCKASPGKTSSTSSNCSCSSWADRKMRCQFQATKIAGKDQWYRLSEKDDRLTETKRFQLIFNEITRPTTTTTTTTSTTTTTTPSTTTITTTTDTKPTAKPSISTNNGNDATTTASGQLDRLDQTSDTTSGQALTMVPFGVSMIAVNGVVILLVIILIFVKRSHCRSSRYSSHTLGVELQENGTNQIRGEPRQGPRRGRIYEEIPDGTSLARPPFCRVQRRGQTQNLSPQALQGSPNARFANSLAESLDIQPFASTSPALGSAGQHRRRESGDTNQSTAPPTPKRNTCQSIISSSQLPARRTWDPIAAPTFEGDDGDDDLPTVKPSRSHSEPSTALAIPETSRASCLSARNPTNDHSELMQIIARLTSVVATHASMAPPTVLPNSQPASPQHTYTGLRSSATPSAQPSSELTVPKCIYTIAATPTKETYSQSVISKQAGSNSDTQNPLDLTLNRSFQRSQSEENKRREHQKMSKSQDAMMMDIYQRAPASETFLKTVEDSATRSRAQNVYEQSISTGSGRGTKDKFGPQKAKPTSESFDETTGDSSDDESLPGSGKAAQQSPPADYLHPVTDPELLGEPRRPASSGGREDEDGYLRPESTCTVTV